MLKRGEKITFSWISHLQGHFHRFRGLLYNPKTSQVALSGKDPAFSEGDIRDVGSIPGSGRSSGGGHGGNHSSILAWRIPGTEEPVRSTGSQRVAQDWGDLAHTLTVLNIQVFRMQRKQKWHTVVIQPENIADSYFCNFLFCTRVHQLTMLW